MKTIAIEAEGINFRYGSQVVLRDASLRIPEGDFVAVIGPNGGGKSTLLRILLGLLTPDSGTVRLLGQSPTQARTAIGYVPQDTGTNRDFPITAEDVVMLGLRAGNRGKSISKSEARDRARTALRRCGMEEKRARLIGQLSGGERQRVYIARALANEPKLLFLDEPTSSIDPAWQKSIHDLFNELNETMTIALVSHDISVISRNVKSVLCVNRSAHYHPSPEITPAMLESTYHCPVELIAHGVPHRVFPPHEGVPEAHPHDCTDPSHNHGGRGDA